MPEFPTWMTIQKILSPRRSSSSKLWLKALKSEVWDLPVRSCSERDNRHMELRPNPEVLYKWYIELNKQNFYLITLANVHVHNKHHAHSEGKKWSIKMYRIKHETDMSKCCNKRYGMKRWNTSSYSRSRWNIDLPTGGWWHLNWGG